ncbi:5'/3'-nucleotidase SurE [Endozoicomonas sp. Mp262]|uniref:5'/3'-nucleotidase SurE n=1 Tax=Endozoicomonas sp. Mp262 TaxID=2919499 RepID=UPI0021D91D4D
MKILLSNDDGFAAAGLSELYQHISTMADCVVVAPDRDCSGLSSSITLDRPLRVTEHDNGFISIDGTPADCVHLALNGLMDKLPDRVISGINLGANLGDDVLYSGTVGAAMEGRFMSKCALALSVCGRDKSNLESAGRVVKRLFSVLDRLDVPKGTVLNINIPACDFGDIRGMKVTRLGHRERPAPPVKVVDPRGKAAYWVAKVGRELDAGEGTDFHAIANNYISITPLQYDQTHHGTLSQVGKWLGVNL